jgi:YHS domain-containing protein
MFKDPVCNMMVDEKKAKFVSESGGGRKYIYAQQHARVSLKGILPVWLFMASCSCCGIIQTIIFATNF